MNTAPSDRTRIRRIAENAAYDRETLYAIIDEAYLCQIAFADARGTHCIPMACWREDDYLYIHGSNGGRLAKQLLGGTQVCVNITHLDGLVLARSAFNHSMNYRSAMIYGQFEAVTDEAAKRASLARFMELLAPGRQAEIRAGNDKEHAATTVLRLSLAEAACKQRRGGPSDDEADLGVAAWVGVLPLRLQRALPERAADCTAPAPAYVNRWAEMALRTALDSALTAPPAVPATAA